MIHGGVNETILNGNESAKAIDNSSMIGTKPNTDQDKWLREQSSKAVDRLVKRECLWLFLVLDVIILMLKFSLFLSCFSTVNINFLALDFDLTVSIRVVLNVLIVLRTTNNLDSIVCIDD